LLEQITQLQLVRAVLGGPLEPALLVVMALILYLAQSHQQVVVAVQE
jgi:hypothetical protein